MILFSKNRFIQTGPTCGFYSLVYAIEKLGIEIDKGAVVKEIISHALDHDSSKVGEIFDVKKFKEYASWIETYTGVATNIKIEEIPERIELHENEAIILPIQGKRSPHFMVITESKKGKVKCWNPGDGKIKKYKYKERKDKNSMIPNNFDWFKYRDKDRNLSNRKKRSDDPTIRELLEKRWDKKKSRLPAKEKTNMKGYIVRLTKL